MSAHTLNLDIPDPEAPGIWPWILALVCGALLVITVTGHVRDIPNSLQRQALGVLSANQLTGVALNLDGRELTVSGSIENTVDREGLLLQMAGIEGIRSVWDDLSVVDPEAKARAELERFQQALSNIRTEEVIFEPGSAAFASGSRQALESIVQLLRGYPEHRVRISGHTDNTGRPQVNLRISRERAQAVADYLISSGVAAAQVTAQGYGASQPIADNATEDGRARNRRIEISYTN